MLDLFQIQRQILRPKRGALSHGRELGRLKMRIAQRRQVLPLQRKRAERVDRAGQSRCDQLHRLAHDDQVGIIDDILAGGPQMDDPLGGRRGFLKGVNVGHHVMPQPLLPVAGSVEVDVVELRLHLAQG